MKNPHRHFGKWSAFLASAALVAASGQACPTDMMATTPASSLTGLWTGPIGGNVTTILHLNAPEPPNPNPVNFEVASHVSRRLTIQFTESGLPVALPLPVSALDPSFALHGVTAFTVGETQTIAETGESTNPQGPADTETATFTSAIGLTVIESTLSADHFRVVYTTTFSQNFAVTGTAPGFMEVTQVISSTGTLTIDATAIGDFVSFSVDFNNNGSIETTDGGGMTNTGNTFSVGSASGLLASDENEN